MQQPQSLYHFCQHGLLHADDHLSLTLRHLRLPSSVHVQLFVEAVLAVKRNGADNRTAIRELVSTWPRDSLSLLELFPGINADCLLHAADGSTTVLDSMIEGLLNMTSQAKLTKVHFSCVTAASIFHLPVLFLPSSKTFGREWTNLIAEKCSEDKDTIESVLLWKLREISQRKVQQSSNYKGPGSVEIYLDTKVSLTEWIAMIDQIIGLSTQQLSPFRFKFTQLSVDNFTIEDSKLLKWFLEVADLEALTNISIYGQKKDMHVVMGELHEHLARIPNLQKFVLGTTGPKLHFPLITSEPTLQKCMERTSVIFTQWNYLQDLELIDLDMSKKLEVWLSFLHKPLQRINLFACKLVKEDLTFLAKCHHLQNLNHLGLENNDLHGCTEELCDIAKSTPKLESLYLLETNLDLHEKLSVISTLHACKQLHTLALHEQDDMLSTSGYLSIVELACGIQSLKKLYAFPFNYRPFEIFYRKEVEDASELILYKNKRTDLHLYY